MGALSGAYDPEVGRRTWQWPKPRQRTNELVLPECPICGSSASRLPPIAGHDYRFPYMRAEVGLSGSYLMLTRLPASSVSSHDGRMDCLMVAS